MARPQLRGQPVRAGRRGGRRHRRGRVPASARRLRRDRRRVRRTRSATSPTRPSDGRQMVRAAAACRGCGGDTYPVPGLPEREPMPIDVRDPRTRSFGHIDPANMEVGKQTQDMLAVSASMRTALLVYSGITVKMMIDRRAGRRVLTMFMVQYEPRGVAGRARPSVRGDLPDPRGRGGRRVRRRAVPVGSPATSRGRAWAASHAFTNPGPGIVRWLETQAPQPPSRHSYRFARDWEYLRRRPRRKDDRRMDEQTNERGRGRRDPGPRPGPRAPLRWRPGAGW